MFSGAAPTEEMEMEFDILADESLTFMEGIETLSF
jgi:hypothetical protein